MLLWASLLVLAPVCGQLEAASKPVISLHPPWTVAFRGETVTLTCNVFHFHAPEKIKRFLWYLGRRMLRETPGNTLEVRDSGQYRCQTQDSLPSDQVNMIFSSGVPVSGVILETQPPEGRALAGEPLVLICSAAEGTGDTTFSWYREDTGESLGRKRRRSQRAQLEIPAVGGSHAGGYFCTADNGHGLACSAVLNVTVTGTPGNRMGLIAAGATGGLLSILVPAVGLLIYRRHQRKSGGGSPGNTTRSPPATGPGQAPHGRCQGQKDSPVELQHLYGNGSLGEGHLVYSEIQTIRPGQKGEASASGASLEDKHATVIYSSVKTRLQGDSAGKVRSQHEDATDSYENVPPA